MSGSNHSTPPTPSLGLVRTGSPGPTSGGAVLPVPEDPLDLERLVVRLARALLEDPAAHRYGRQGQSQFGVDVVATDRRTSATRTRWVFQCKRTATFSVANFEAERARFESFPGRESVGNFIVVTSAERDRKVQDAAAAATDSDLDFSVWYWPEFTDLVLEHLGVEAVLSSARRSEARARWCREQIAEYDEAGVLWPLAVPPGQGSEPRLLSSVWVTPTLMVDKLDAEDPDRVAVPSTANPRDWLDSVCDSGQRVLILEAGVGAGKTTLLLRWSRDLSSHAVEEPERGLPMRIGAASIAEWSTSLPASGPLPPPPGAPTDLWGDPLTDWYLLVDGLDELADDARPRVRRGFRRLVDHPRVLAIVAAGRPTLQRGVVSNALRVRLAGWGGAQRAAFERAWGLRDLDDEVGAEAEGGNPLVLTLRALFSGGTKNSLDVELFKRALQHIVEAWPRLRAGAREPTQGHYDALTQVAIAEHSLQDLGLEELDAQETDLVSRRFMLRELAGGTGLLEHDAAGHPRVTVRALSEYLAARALDGVDAATLVLAASRPGFQEVVRLAVQQRAIEDAVAAAEAMSALLASARHMPPPQRLRILGTALRVVETTSALLETHASALVSVLLEAACNPASPWLRQVASGWLRRARSTSPTWIGAVVDTSLPLISQQGSRAEALWATLKGTDLPESGRLALCLHLLQDEDEAVRVVGVYLAAERASDVALQSLLCIALRDAGSGAHNWMPPAVAAGLALRQVPRAHLGPRVLELLRGSLSGGQFRGGSAALALRPSEAEADVLREKLESLWGGAKVPEVRAAIELLDGAADRELGLPPLPTPTAEAVEGASIPLAVATRLDLTRGVAPVVAAVREVRELPTHLLDSTPFLEGAIEGPLVIDDDVAFLLRRWRSKWKGASLSSSVHVALGARAARSETIWGTMVEWWSAVDAPSAHCYPGVALEQRVEAGDAEAERILAEWMPHCVPVTRERELERPAPWLQKRVLRRQSLRSLGLPLLRSLVDARRVHPPWKSEQLFRRLYPVWVETDVARALQVRACEDDPMTASARHWWMTALGAWQDSGLPPALAEKLVACLYQEEYLNSFHWMMPLGVGDQLRIAARSGFAEELEDLLRWLLKAGLSNNVYWAATLLAELRPEEAASISAECARLWPRPLWQSPEPAEEDYRRLIAAAPGEWLSRAQAMPRGAGEIPLLALLERLGAVAGDSPKLRAGVMAELERLSVFPIPWLSDGRGQFRYLRVADRAAELLYTLDFA